MSGTSESMTIPSARPWPSWNVRRPGNAVANPNAATPSTTVPTSHTTGPGEGTTSRERYLFAYEPRYNINPDLFSYGLAQYERDRIQGFDARYALSGGLGYNVIATPNLKLSAKAGPAFRRTELLDGTALDRLGALAGFDAAWRVGAPVVRALVAGWSRYETSPPGASPD